DVVVAALQPEALAVLVHAQVAAALQAEDRSAQAALVVFAALDETYAARAHAQRRSSARRRHRNAREARAAGEKGSEHESKARQATRPLAPGEGLAILVFFPKGVVESPSHLERGTWSLDTSRGVPLEVRWTLDHALRKEDEDRE